MAPRSLPTRLARRLHLSSEGETTARSLLGPGHPLTRALTLQRTLAMQILVVIAVVVLGLVGVLSRGTGAVLVVIAASVVGVALVVSSLVARGLVRERVQELIAAGFETRALPVLELERRRLGSRRERERLARSLEGYVRDAESWDDIWWSFRPVVEPRCLRVVASQARETAELLRSDRADVRGVAATARLLVDGTTSPLFLGDEELLRHELDRIRALLGADDRGHSRRAAA